jgi:hypothetical protein
VMISLVIFFLHPCFASVLPLPLLMCILSYKYLLQGCVLLSNSVLTLFYQHVYRPESLARSLTTRSPHSFRLVPFLFLFALMLILDGLFHSLSITLFSPALSLHSFDHLFVDVFSDSCRLSVTMAYLLSSSSTSAHLTTISYFCLGVTNKS